MCTIYYRVITLLLASLKREGKRGREGGREGEREVV